MEEEITCDMLAEPGISSVSEVVPEEITDDDIRKLGDNKTLNQLRELGTFLSKQKTNTQIQKSENKEKDFFAIAVAFLISGKNTDAAESTAFDKLASRNAQLLEADQFTLEELQDIKEHAGRYIELMQREKREAVAIAKAEQEQAEEDHEPDEIDISAEELLETGKLYGEFMRLFSTLHVADLRKAEVLLMGFLAQSLQDPDVIIQPVLDGEKGSGKSSGVLAALHLMPRDYVCEAALSPNALFRFEMNDKSIIYIDDDTWNPELGAAIKRYMNDVTKGTEYITLNQNREPERLKFPLKCMFITSCVGDSGDDQLLDRQFRITVSKGPDKQKNHQMMVKKEIATGQNRRLIENKEIEIVRRALLKFRDCEFRVVIPEAMKMRFVDGASMRDIEVFKIFLRASVILHFKQRLHDETKDGITTVWSKGEQYKEDLNFANQVFKMNAEQRKLKLNESEQKVYEKIKELASLGQEITINTIVNETGGKYNTTYAAIFGRNHVGGLVSKVGGLYVRDESEKISDNKTTRMKIVTISPGFSVNFNNLEFAYYE